LRKIRGHTDGVRDLIQLQNGKLASNSSTEIIIWNLYSGTSTSVIKNPGKFNCILEAASNILVAGGETGLTFWKLNSLENVAPQLLISIDTSIIQQSTSTPQKSQWGYSIQQSSTRIQQSCTSIVRIRNQGIACVVGTQICIYYNPLTQENGKTILQHSDVHALVFSDRRNTLISGDTGGGIRIWSLDKLVNLITFPQQHRKKIRSLIVADCGTLISSSDDGTVKFWNMDLAQSVKTIEVKGVGGMNVSNDALVICGEDRGVGYMSMWLLSK